MTQRREAAFAHALSAYAVFAIALVLATAASCASPEREGTAETKAVQIAAATPGVAPGDLDVLFMIDDSSGMTSMQTKLAAQVPFFIQALQSLPYGLPNIHIAVVSSDLGAPGDSTSVTCTTAGDQGLFRLSPSCTSSTLMDNATYVSNVDGLANYTGNLADVLACITPLGDTGCGFGHQLGSIARALGADGAPAPARNAGFLRPGADLAILILSDTDDCSATVPTYLYSINNGQNNLTNSRGPLTRYRCNEFGHLCHDPAGDPQRWIQPPETAPADTQGTPSAPTLSLTDCESLDTDGLLTPVTTLVSGIRALKADPDSQIFVGAIVAPAAPYTVDWVPPVGGQNLRPGELWPQIEHSCGANDGSSGDPAVRITQLVKGFGAHGVSTSICDPSSSYASLLIGLANKIGDHLQRGGGPATDSGAGGSGGGVAGVGGAVATDAGLGLSGGGGSPGNSGTSGSPTPVTKTNGLMHGGCDVGASGPGTWGLTLLVGFLIARRRARRSVVVRASTDQLGERLNSSLPAARRDLIPLSLGSVPAVPIAFTGLAIAFGLATASCAQPKVDSPVGSRPAAVTAAATGTSPGNLDVLFMIDNSSSMTSMQQKLVTQIPGFVTALQNLPAGLPNIHIAIVSSDLGAPGDSTSSIQCTPDGDQGIFRTGTSGGGSVSPHGLDGGASGGAPGGDDAADPGCAGASLNSGATFISNVDGVANYTGDLSALLSCMTSLGQQGCGFEHQLASISRALGADGSLAPAQNAGFLRPDAQLAIVVLSNEDDCSAPANTELYSLNGGQQNISNPLGPIANYRCNQFGHLCVDPAASGPTCLTEPPARPPADAQGTATAPSLNLTACASDESDGLLISVSSFVNGIRALKADPDNQIVVGAIVAPPTPYTVAWLPAAGGQNTSSGELWPSVEHSCGPAGGDDVNPAGQSTTDGSFGDPAVRVAQWVQGFGANGVTASVCDGSYANAFGAIADKIAAHLSGGKGSVSGSAGTSGAAAVPICPDGITHVSGGSAGGGSSNSGLQNGGCDVAAARPTAASLGALILFLVVSAAVARRRRVSARRSSVR